LLRYWKKTTGNGYANIPNNVVHAYYDSTNVYIQSNSIPAYTIGPWNVPSSNYPTTAKNYKATFSLSPKLASTKTKTSLGPIGMFVDGTFL
jgi:hypothetical protein